MATGKVAHFDTVHTVTLTGTTDAWGQISIWGRFEVTKEHFISAFSSSGVVLLFNSDYTLRAFAVGASPLSWATNTTIEFTVVYH